MYENIVKTAQEAGAAASDIHRYYAKRGFSSASKEKEYDIVTQVDFEAEKKIVEIIKNSFPSHNIVAEENNYAQTASDYTWFIDPLDGTVNYFKRLPYYAVSIGVVYKDNVIVGIVQNTAGNEVFSAVRGEGSFCNEHPIHVANTETIKNALLYTGFYYDRGEKMKKTLQTIDRFFSQGIIGIRRSGCAALDLCSVAAGRGDGFWEHFLSPWDFSAGSLIISEAGGVVTNFSGNTILLERSSVLASNSRLHGHLKNEIQKIY